MFGQKSEKARAIENYEKFLDLWNGLRSSQRKDADPGIAEVSLYGKLTEDAKKRLVGLKRQ